jgi:hypothetical protein
MKRKMLLGLAIALALSSACKKQIPESEPVLPQIEKPDPLESLSDSVFYTIDGKNVSIAAPKHGKLINGQANIRLDSVVNVKQYTSADRDSLLFGRSITFMDLQDNQIEIFFLKKYHKNQAQPPSKFTPLFMPVNVLDLFSTGPRNFVLDYERSNATNGVAIKLSGQYYGLQTFGYSNLAFRPALSPALHTNSSFEILSLKKLKSGKYMMEAKFETTVFWGDGTHIKGIDNGFIRVKLDPNNIYM